MLSLFTRTKRSDIPPTPLRKSLPQLIASTDQIPTLSDTSLRACAMANSADATLADFTDLISRDAAIAAVVLKRANSAALGGATADLSQAVLRLGLAMCSQLAATIGMQDMLRKYPPPVRERCEAILRHSLLVANLTSLLNRALKCGHKGEEFTSGLLHDIGRIIMTAQAPDNAAWADPIDFNEGPDLLARERNAFGGDHCGIGGLFAKANKLPETVTHVILRHHSPEDEREHRGLVALVVVADQVANHVQKTRTIQGFEPTGAGYDSLSDRWQPKHHEQFAGVLPGLVKAAVRATRTTLRAV